LLNTLPVLSRSTNFINRSNESSVTPTNTPIFNLQNILISQNNLHYLTNKDLLRNNTTSDHTTNNVSLEHQLLMHLTNYDLFSYDFTDLALQILRKPTSTNSTYPYFSFTAYSNVSPDTLATWTINKLK
jgi:hypothetical protein